VTGTIRRRMTLRRPAALVTCALAFAVPLAGCGNKEEEIHSAETEGAYLDLGDLRYQVQISRQLNPRDVEDRAYLTGVTRDQARLKPGESWFGVFLRVENNTKTTKESAVDFELEDTSEAIYRPVPISPTNPFAYVGGPVARRSTLPAPGSVAQLNESVGGALVLFKVKTESFANRPLELKILGPTVPQDVATLDLDV
jgi:hypothetical protein